MYPYLSANRSIRYCTKNIAAMKATVFALDFANDNKHYYRQSVDAPIKNISSMFETIQNLILLRSAYIGFI